MKRGRTWWVQVCVDGRVIRQSSHSERYEDAKKLRDRLLGQRARGELGGHGARHTINNLLDLYLRDQELKVKPETLKIEKLVVDRHLRPYFGRLNTGKLTSERLLDYRRIRAQEGASPTTCNRELSYLRTALRVASRTTPPTISAGMIPHFPMVNEDAFARTGFVEDSDFEKLLVEMPQYLVPLVVTAYNTGIRRGELLRIDWGQVDFQAGVIRLHRGRTKTGEPRMVPMIGRMREALLRAKAEKDEFWPDCTAVFSRLGQRIRSFKNAWEAACERAGVRICSSMTFAGVARATYPGPACRNV